MSERSTYSNIEKFSVNSFEYEGEIFYSLHTEPVLEPRRPEKKEVLIVQHKDNFNISKDGGKTWETLNESKMKWTTYG